MFLYVLFYDSTIATQYRARKLVYLLCTSSQWTLVLSVMYVEHVLYKFIPIHRDHLQSSRHQATRRRTLCKNWHSTLSRKSGTFWSGPCSRGKKVKCRKRCERDQSAPSPEDLFCRRFLFSCTVMRKVCFGNRTQNIQTPQRSNLSSLSNQPKTQVGTSIGSVSNHKLWTI